MPLIAIKFLSQGAINEWCWSVLCSAWKHQILVLCCWCCPDYMFLYCFKLVHSSYFNPLWHCCFEQRIKPCLYARLAPSHLVRTLTRLHKQTRLLFYTHWLLYYYLKRQMWIVVILMVKGWSNLLLGKWIIRALNSHFLWDTLYISWWELMENLSLYIQLMDKMCI